ncbi:MAG: hypothetical protein KDD14_19700 [Saprospiraceae bacterium]|nr:hypothetical protein [Saprospiraceae bacterium]
MNRFFKQRWVIAALAVAATLLFIKYVYPKLRKTQTVNQTTTPETGAPPPPPQTLRSRLVGNVTASVN